ncbi:MAG: hydantoinase B/oxoprolinase family protein [Betaproteobacteria bacterium]|nr:hydantoinase B/oxoprolinase family protein [Betaproteobacteria bacterium]
MSEHVLSENKQLVDPISAEIIRHGLQSIPDQIEVDITRTAYSVLIYEYKDYAVGLVDVQGRLICQCKGGIPIFLANVLGLAVRDGIALYGLEGMEPGDVIISNHAGTFGQHLNNVIMYTPIFGGKGGKQLIAFMCVLAHWIDVGGRYVGSSASNDTTDIFQEGIQFRSIKLRRAGQPVAEIYRMIEYNTRFPYMTLGDCDAQLSGCLKGRALFEELLGKYGTETVIAAIGNIWKQSEAAARAAVLAIPDGVYEASSFLDNDGVKLDQPIEINIIVRVEGDEMTVDFSNISPEVRGPFNSGAQGGGITAARLAFKYLTTPSEPTNEGSFKPLHVVLPEGKFLSAGPTAALARYSAPLPTVIDTIIRAIADSSPERVTAGHHANMGSHRFQGKHPLTGALFSHLDTAHGGWGASLGRDGAGPYKTLAHGDTLDVPVEVQEALYPIRVDACGFRTDSGGYGEYRGGLGLDKAYTVGAPCALTVTFERHGCPPWGIFGGGNGEPGYVEIERAGEQRRIVLKVSDTPLDRGDRVFIHTGGGGGFGEPLQRSPARVALDVEAGFVSRDAARALYGVALNESGGIDDAETARLRTVHAKRS